METSASENILKSNRRHLKLNVDVNMLFLRKVFTEKKIFKSWSFYCALFDFFLVPVKFPMPRAKVFPKLL